MKFLKDDLIMIIHGDEPEGFSIVHKGQWIADYKVEICEIVFGYDHKTYIIDVSRSGSHYSDWYYDYEDWDNEVECDEVEPHEITTIEWRKVK